MGIHHSKEPSVIGRSHSALLGLGTCIRPMQTAGDADADADELSPCEALSTAIILTKPAITCPTKRKNNNSSFPVFHPLPLLPCSPSHAALAFHTAVLCSVCTRRINESFCRSDRLDDQRWEAGKQMLNKTNNSKMAQDIIHTYSSICNLHNPAALVCGGSIGFPREFRSTSRQLYHGPFALRDGFHMSRLVAMSDWSWIVRGTCSRRFPLGTGVQVARGILIGPSQFMLALSNPHESMTPCAPTFFVICRVKDMIQVQGIFRLCLGTYDKGKSLASCTYLIILYSTSQPY